MPVGGATVSGPEHWTDTQGRASECVISTMSGPPPKTTQDRHKGHTPNPRTEIKIPDPAGNRTRAAGDLIYFFLITVCVYSLFRFQKCLL